VTAQVALFGAVMTISLVLMSLLIRIRMQGYGRSSRQIWAAVGELWLTFAAIAAVLWGAGRLLGEPTAEGATGELADIGQRFAGISASMKAWVVLGGVISVAIFVRLVSLLRRYMEEPAEPGGPG
jgi:hypothetical protein